MDKMALGKCPQFFARCNRIEVITNATKCLTQSRRISKSSSNISPATTQSDKLLLLPYNTPGDVDVSDRSFHSSLDLGDFKNAFSAKSTKELFRSLLVLSMCSSEFLVNNSLEMFEKGQKLVGKKLVNMLVRPTIYQQFVGGADKAEVARCTEKIQRAGVGVMFAVPIEDEVQHCPGESWYDQSLAVILRSLALAHEYCVNSPMIQLRATALVPSHILEIISKEYPEPSDHPEMVEEVASCIRAGRDVQLDCLSEEENMSFNKGLQRLVKLGKKARRCSVTIWVDAEYTFVNPAINLLVLALSLNYNTAHPHIAATYQNYLRNTDTIVSRHLDFLHSRDVCFGAKLVRGAYMVKERLLAHAGGYPDPINDTRAHTDDMYHRSMDVMLKEIARNPRTTGVILASHNEETVLKATASMSSLGINRRHVNFGQLYGMCDHISYSLGQNGYKVFKSIPYGTIDDTLPYLTRRAQENRAVLGGIRREKSLLFQALKDKLTDSPLYRKHAQMYEEYDTERFHGVGH